MSILDQMFQTYASPALQHWFGVTVTLQRGERKNTGVVATWWKVPDEVDLEDLPNRIVNRVYRIAVESYVINSKVVEPRRGDIIVEMIAGKSTKFQVLPTEDENERELDGDGHHWILRTKKI